VSRFVVPPSSACPGRPGSTKPGEFSNGTFGEFTPGTHTRPRPSPELEARGLEYILSARERSDAVVSKIVLENDDPFVPLLVACKAGETQLFVKQVKLEALRK
jgi:hypothetical protein